MKNWIVPIVLTALCLPRAAAQEPAPESPPRETPQQETPEKEPGEKEAPEQKLPPQPARLLLGTRVNAEVTLRDLDGKPVRAGDLMGKVTVINFYSIQCPIQRAWDARLAAIQADFEQKGVVFLHIDSNVTEIGKEPPKEGAEEKPYEKVRAHLTKSGLPFRVLVDHGNVVADLFQAKTTPHVYVFGRDGRLCYRGLVDDDQKDRRPDSRNDYLRDTLTKLLDGTPFEPFETKEVGCSIKRVDSDAKGEGRRPGRGRRERRAGGGGR